MSIVKINGKFWVCVAVGGYMIPHSNTPFDTPEEAEQYLHAVG